jgi:hypothetical protein
MLGLTLVVIAGMWKTFSKAGKPGWACLVPIYNLIVMLQIAGRPLWWFVLLLIPMVNFIVAIIIMVDIARAFGKGVVFGVFGLALFGFIGFPMLGFGSAQYGGGSSHPMPSRAPGAGMMPSRTVPTPGV